MYFVIYPWLFLDVDRVCMQNSFIKMPFFHSAYAFFIIIIVRFFQLYSLGSAIIDSLLCVCVFVYDLITL